MGKGGKNNRFNKPKNEMDNLKDDVKKVGYDIRDLYKKSNIKIPKPGGEKSEIGRWIIISVIILILIMSKVGIPFAIIILIFILVLLLYR